MVQPKMPNAELGQHLGEGQELFLGSDVAGQPAPVLGTVLQVLVRRQAEGPRLHRIVQDLLHLVELGLGHRGPFPGRYHAQHVAPKRGEGHQTADVHAQALAVQAVHVFGEGLPVPAHALAHGLQGDGLDAVHHPHVQFTVFRPGWRETETALAHRQRSDPELAGQGSVGVPVELGVVVGVEVDRSWRYDAAAGVQFLGAGAVYAPADHRHAAVFDAQIGAELGNARAVDDRAAANHQVKLSHYVLLGQLRILSVRSVAPAPSTVSNHGVPWL